MFSFTYIKHFDSYCNFFKIIQFSLILTAVILDCSSLSLDFLKNEWLMSKVPSKLITNLCQCTKVYYATYIHSFINVLLKIQISDQVPFLDQPYHTVARPVTLAFEPFQYSRETSLHSFYYFVKKESATENSTLSAMTLSYALQTFNTLSSMFAFDTAAPVPYCLL